MKFPAVPDDESARLEVLRGICQLDTAQEERFDRITRIAAGRFNVSMALISLVDEDRQWFKSHYGVETRETPRSVSFCGHAILGTETMVVEDAALDPRFHDNPLVTGPPHIRFYAGHPLRTPSGMVLGTLCIIDETSRQFSSEDRSALRDIAKLAEIELMQQSPEKNRSSGRPRSTRFLSRWPVSASLRDALRRITSRAGATALASLLSAGVLLFGLEWAHQDQLLYRAKLEQELIERVSMYRGQLESSLNSRLHLVHGLAGYVRAGGALDEERFQRFASKLGSSLDNVRSLQLAPNGIVKHVWPREGNEAAIGHDLLGDPERRAAAEAAIAARRLWVAGPLRLLQGGVALIGRQPIFTALEGDGAKERFWGFATILVDMPQLLEEVGIRASDGVFRFALRGKDAMGSRGEVFMGDLTVFETEPAIAEITLPAGSWELAGIRTDLLESNIGVSIGIAIAAGAGSVLLGLLVFFLLRLPHALHGAVAAATAALERSESRFRDAIEALPDGFVIFDENDRLVMSNENYRRMYDVNRPALQEGQFFQDIIRYGFHNDQYAVESDADVERLIQDRLSAHADPGRPFEQKLHDGRWIRVVESRMRDGGIVGFRSEITELKNKQQELKLAKEKAEDANRAKSEFLATVSHEVRTPLNGLLGMLDVLKDDPLLNESHRLQANTAYESSQHLLDILNQILDLSKLESGTLELEPERTQVRSVVEKVVALQESVSKRKGLTISSKVSRNVPDWVITDSMRLRQILHNLLSNAVKFTDHGSVSLKVESHARNDEFICLGFTVRDTGIGFSGDDTERIFDKFTQLDSSATRRHEGTGLGLTICRSLIRMMDGDIKAEPNPDGGAIFRFDIQVEIAEPETSPVTRTGPYPISATCDASPVRVLAVEDSLTNQMVLEFMLKGTVYELDCVDSGQKAIEALSGAPYELVLMDISMPGMDGIEATRRIRVMSLASQPPIIALTANAMAGDRERFLEAGMDDYLPKPIVKVQLLKKLTYWTSQERDEHRRIRVLS